MSRVHSVFEGCYEAPRAAALAGVPRSTVYHWARRGVVVPSISQDPPKMWSYADLMALRIVYWLRHPKADNDVPASPMGQVREAIAQLETKGIDLWRWDERGHFTPLLVDRTGRIFVAEDDGLRTVRGQGSLAEVLDLLGPFGPGDGQGAVGPDLRRPAPHLRIVPGKVSGEPHLAQSRLTTPVVAALAERGYTVEQIARLYPDEDPDGIREAIALEQQLAA